MRRALEVSERLIRRPGSQRAAGQGVEREAGYVILSALCVCAGPELLKVCSPVTLTILEPVSRHMC